jgi:predicted nuclease of predicted toxin-antitoxin system
VKFKLDENVPWILKKLIESVGNHQVDSVFHENLMGIDDIKLVSLCKKEERILITQDSDFTNIHIFPDDCHCGIILIKNKTQGKKAIQKLFSDFLKSFNLDTVKNNLIIIESNQYKIRNMS